MSEKEFPPSELRLQRLRLEGIVPFSRELSAFFVFLVVFGVMIFGFTSAKRHFSQLRRKFTLQLSGGSSLPEFSDLAILLGAAAMLSLLVAALIFLGGLIQNRFLLTSRALLRSPGLFNLAFFRGSGGRLLNSVGRLIMGLALILGAALAGHHSLSLLLEPQSMYANYSEFDQKAQLGVNRTKIGQTDSLGLLRESMVGRTTVAARLLSQVALLSVFLVGMFGIVSRVVAVQSFRHAQQMTREEVEAELRETEPSPEMRQRQRE